jgi:hypothetical protein
MGNGGGPSGAAVLPEPAGPAAGMLQQKVAEDIMVWLGGPRRRPGNTRGPGVYLHDPPPGYSPPQMPLKDRQRMARQDWILMRVSTVVLVLAAAAFMVIIVVIIATRT